MPMNALAAHRDEIARFASAVAGAQVTFDAISYRDWLAKWQPSPVAKHAAAILERFRP
jgi:hypothetical protein